MSINALVITDHNYKNKGNIVIGLCKLEELIRSQGGSLVWLFTPHVAECEWTKKLKDCYFLTDDNNSDKKLIARIVKKHKINVIHTHFCSQNVLAAVKLYCLRHRRVHFVRHMHMLYFAKSNIIAEKLKQLLSAGEVNVACSPMCADTMKHAGVRNVVTVTNGVDFDSLSPKRNEHEGIHVLMFGYNYINKGVRLAISSMQLLALPGIVLDICVVGDLEKVKGMIQDDFGAIPDFVNFVEPSENVSELYANADIFLSSGSIESYCFAVREALYCGCRVVASNIPSQVMNCGEVLFDAGSEQCLAEALRQAINLGAPTKEQSMLVRSAFVSTSQWADKMLEVYKSVVSE